jgi:hypothetical protein
MLPEAPQESPPLGVGGCQYCSLSQDFYCNMLQMN